LENETVFGKNIHTRSNIPIIKEETMILNCILLILGFALLVKGADFLVDGASSVAKKFHIPEIVIGLTIVAIGTSMPELVVSVQSALEGHSDIALGNIVGSNLANMFLILGICAIIQPLAFKKETRIFENPIMLVVTILFFLMCKIGAQENTISTIEGSLLLGLCILFILYNIIMAKKGQAFDATDGEEIEEHGNDMPIWKAILYIVLGITALKFGGDFVVDNAVAIASALGISEKLISVTIVAIATSLPELVTSISATRKGETDMAIGNILGSQIFNILLIIGTAATLSPINYSVAYDKDMWVLVAGSLLLCLYPYIGTKNKMTANNGILFVVIYGFYMANLIFSNM